MKSEAIMDFPMIPCAFAQAQILNEMAIELSEDGEYDRALSVLTKALQMWKSYRSEDEREEVCLSSRCQCQPKGETQCMEIDDDSISASSSTTKSMPQEDTEEEHPITFEHGYLYQELIRIPCRQIFEAGNVGSAVALIILFNLAIVQHMNACTSGNKKRMGKTLRLYQLSNECFNSFINDTHSCSRKAGAFELGTIIQMILINNLSHLHSIMGNRSTSVHCTEKLIPILMCVVDDKARNNYDSEFSSDVWHVSLEGFFRNISPLVLTSQCADAA